MRKRRNGFFIGLAVAALTFGGLWMGLGSEQFNRGHKLCEHEKCCLMEHHQQHCEDACKTVEAPMAKDSVAE